MDRAAKFLETPEKDMLFVFCINLTYIEFVVVDSCMHNGLHVPSAIPTNIMHCTINLISQFNFVVLCDSSQN